MCASYVANALNLQTVPGLADVNALAQKVPYLYGLTFHILDQDITVELTDGKQFSGNPFADNVLCLTENAVLGKTWWVEPVGDEELEEEVTQGIANAFPGWSGSERAYFLDTKNTTWKEGA